MNLGDINSLPDLWEYTEKIHDLKYPKSNLKPVMSGGRLINPKFMFVFINPTYRNISSDPAWKASRRPWIGTRYVWKIFTSAGLFDQELLFEIQNKKIWSAEFADKVYEHLNDKSIYFTNLVKWSGENSDLPNADMVNTFTPILLRELSIVKPEYIVTFGLIPYKALTKNNIKLNDIYNKMLAEDKLQYETFITGNYTCKLVPCYFPVGRGNPKRATEILIKLSK